MCINEIKVKSCERWIELNYDTISTFTAELKKKLILASQLTTHT